LIEAKPARCFWNCQDEEGYTCQTTACDEAPVASTTWDLIASNSRPIWIWFLLLAILLCLGYWLYQEFKMDGWLGLMGMKHASVGANLNI
jgi:hypothetical protein